MAVRHYLGIAEPGPHNWSISFPAFPGTVSMADTFAELLVNARDALASAIEALQEDKLEIPESFEGGVVGSPSYKATDYHDPHIVIIDVEDGEKALRVNVTLPQGLVSRLDHLAERDHTTRSALLARGARRVLADS